MPFRRRRTLSALAPAALVLLALAGCGGGKRTSAHVTTATVTQTVTTPAPAAPATAPARTSTASAPAPNPSAPLSLHAAEHALAARGYATLSERDWRPDQPLKVLVGVALSSPAGSRVEQAFFFVGATFIGTDTRDPSGQIAVVTQGGGSVTLSYGLYRPADAIDAPSAGSAEVTYRWTGARLVPQGPIPSAAPAASPSRR